MEESVAEMMRNAKRGVRGFDVARPLSIGVLVLMMLPLSLHEYLPGTGISATTRS